MKNASIRLLLITLIFLAGRAPLFAQEQSGVIRGRLIDAEDETGVENANVNLQSSMLYSGRDVTTQRGGFFTFDKLPPGNYTIQAYPDGYFSSDPVQVVLDGRENNDIVMRVQSKATVGTISGTVRDADDKPLARVRVCAEHKIFNRFGDALITSNLADEGSPPQAGTQSSTTVTPDGFGGTLTIRVGASAPLNPGRPPVPYEVCASTNAEGRYSTDRIDPGTYFIEVVADFRSFNKSGTFYPGVDDSRYAVPIPVEDRPVSGVDIRVDHHPTWTLRGEIAPSGPLKPTTAMDLTVSRDGRIVLRTTAPPVAGSDKRAFSIPGLSAGSYTVEAKVAGETLRPTVDPAAPAGIRAMTGVTRVDIHSEDVNDVLIAMDPDVTFKVVVLRPGEDLNAVSVQQATAVQSAMKLGIMIFSVNGGESFMRDANGNTIVIPRPPKDLPRPALTCRSGAATTRRDAAWRSGPVFEFTGVPRSECLLEVSNLPGDDYVESASLDGDNIWDRVFVPGPSASNLVINLSDGGGAVTGRVLDEQGNVDPGLSTVILAPVTRSSDHPSAEIHVLTEVNGSFEVHNVRPGSYHLLAFQYGWTPKPFNNAAVLSEYETRGPLVTVDKGGRVSSDTVVIRIP